ncbi:iron dicitrate transport regulator FecR [Caulobacter radicis]|uniref:FecR family protein n=1 Tax=Caulobacter radicis TaxID=2172650 RepID=UPI000D5882C1|nr:FecR family protein [Caulobacter radicis]PVM91759.1 iron dicitrate transport regulator FecR [Caulobacter radicis]
MDKDGAMARAVDKNAAERDAADREAADWYARLSGGPVSNGELNAFFAWRSKTLNDAAYTRIEALTTTARALADAPALRALADEAVARRRERPRTRPRQGAIALMVGAALTTVAIAGAVAWRPWAGQVYSTPVGERRAVTLADGSSIELNTDSQVRVRLSKTERALTLMRGQAMFSVHHDPVRPFVVTAGDTRVRAIGTRFEVYRSGEAVRVTLAEGRVRVSSTGAAAPIELKAGERVETAPATPALPTKIDVAAATGWTQGRLTFREAPLAEAVAEVNRYSRRHVRLGPGAPLNLPISGVFDAGDTEAFALGAGALHGLKTTRLANGDIELSAATPG